MPDVVRDGLNHQPAGHFSGGMSTHTVGHKVQAQAVIYPDIIRSALNIPEDKLIALGISIGYPDRENPINEEWRAREPMEKVVSFHGFD